MNLRKYLEMIRAYRAGAPLGDVVVMKLDAYASHVASRLQGSLAPLREAVPRHDLPALRQLPAGTLGCEYARFLDANGIEPLVISPAIHDRYLEDPWALRYTVTHDLHHVLTGFDTGLAGEIGALAFYVGQGSAPVGEVGLWAGKLIYSLLAPGNVRELWHNVRVGVALGKQADLVIAQPLEAWFEEPLAAVRAKLRIPEPSVSGILPSRPSVLADIIYPRKTPRPA
jgi:ubiquinone biosynthesis protein Coq4